MIYLFQRADIMAIQHNLSLQLVPVPLDLVVFYHDNNHVHVAQEGIKVVELVGNDVLMDEGIIYFQRAA